MQRQWRATEWQPDQLLEPVQVQDLDLTTGYFHQLLFPQVGDTPADGFQAQPQVGAYFVAPHLEYEFAG